MDITRELPRDRKFSVVVDRGCLQAIATLRLRRYVRNLAQATSDDARMLAFVKLGDDAAADRAAGRIDHVSHTFRGVFRVSRTSLIYMDKFGGQKPGQELRGVAIWMTRERVRWLAWEPLFATTAVRRFPKAAGRFATADDKRRGQSLGLGQSDALLRLWLRKS